MLSRVALTAYWMSRYMERAENVARFIDVNLHLMLDMPIDESAQWMPLVTVTGDHPIFEERYREPSRENVIEFLTFDPEYPNSIFSCLRQARENARTIRPGISSELWEQANEMYLAISSRTARRRALEHPHAFYKSIKAGATLFKGISDASMTHGEEWQFLRLGRMLERADKTSRILDVKYFILLPSKDYVGSPYDAIHWAAVLKSASALEMYRMERQRVDPNSVAEFLLLARDFPRSVRFCIATAEECLRAITGTPGGMYNNQAERLLGRLSADLDFAHIDDIIRTGLHEYVDDFQSRLNAVGNAIFDTFFATRTTPASLSESYAHAQMQA